MRIACAVLMVLVTLCGTAGALTLAEDGRSDYVIVVAKDAIPAERTAADELRLHLAAVTGAILPVVIEGDGRAAQSKAMVLGMGDRFRKAFPDMAPESLKYDGIVMKTVGDTLYLAGDRPRGTLYAVNTFLEDVVGCRWWSSTESTIPHAATLAIPELNTVYVPKLRVREAFYRGAFEGVFASRLKCNGHFERIPEEHGGHYTIIGWCHTFYQLLPPDQYFADHPEWYSEIGGKRSGEHTQLCLTNDEMRAEFVKQALDWVRQNPDAGMISISQNDWGRYCQCAKCAALDEREGAPSGSLIHFVNAVAAEIEKEFPDFLVETLAYQYTRTAPAHVKPRKNVVVRLCSIECSYAQPLATGEQNEGFRSDIEAWSAIAHQLYIWNYVTNFANYILPHPNMRVLAPNLRLFVDHKAVGLFEQGDSGCSCSDFPELRAYLLAHLMWDPSRDEQALIAEFLQGYYGPAAEPLQAYIDLIHDAVESAGTYLRCYMGGTEDWFTPEQVLRATELFREAGSRVADDSVLARRVHRARMPLDHVWLKRYRDLEQGAQDLGVPFPGPKDLTAFCDAFIEAAHGFNVGSYREGAAFDAYIPALRCACAPAVPAPEEYSGVAAKGWVDVQEGDFSLHGLGRWVFLEEDSDASNGYALRLTTNHTSWAIQYPVRRRVTELGKVRCFASVRCEAKKPEGGAVTIGIYDTEAKAGVTQKVVPASDLSDGRYHLIDLGAFDLNRNLYVWFAPVNNPDVVEAVYVDRVFFVKEAALASQ
ncbi:MAG: DUF4838 domain-containing protein [bacterium]|nr:DUF4838 domain-containing protein [bacterium]